MKLYLIIIFNIIYFILLLFIYLYLVKHLKCNQIEYFQNKTNKPKQDIDIDIDIDIVKGKCRQSKDMFDFSNLDNSKDFINCQISDLVNEFDKNED
tara:strand:+ start:1329 stop:1616 length:288 start_codon:yes stop_codon:yes gene_type:complete